MTRYHAETESFFSPGKAAWTHITYQPPNTEQSISTSNTINATPCGEAYVREDGNILAGEKSYSSIKVHVEGDGQFPPVRLPAFNKSERRGWIIPRLRMEEWIAEHYDSWGFSQREIVGAARTWRSLTKCPFQEKYLVTPLPAGRLERLVGTVACDPRRPSMRYVLAIRPTRRDIAMPPTLFSVPKIPIVANAFSAGYITAVGCVLFSETEQMVAQRALAIPSFPQRYAAQQAVYA